VIKRLTAEDAKDAEEILIELDLCVLGVLRGWSRL
jgi:hypothetical protein